MSNASIAPELQPVRSRISSIDLVRGIVMVIMAIDHIRDYFHYGAFQFDPTDPTQTTPALFFTRWITHYCAPTFVFLSGTSIYLILQRKTKKELSRFLLSRGLWLVFLEFTVVRFSIFFNLIYDATVVQVIYTIGMSMVVFSALIYLSTRAILIIGLMITAGHNLLDPIQFPPGDPRLLPWRLFYQAGPVKVFDGVFFLAQYPFLPWLGIMLLGFSIGRWYTRDFDAQRRQRLLMISGISAIALFVILRGFNIYGDPAPWTTQRNWLYSLFSILNCTKYPVSLAYILMTIGPVLIVLALLERRPIKLLKPLEVFGRVPMFYYILHFYLIHFLALVTYMFIYHKGLSDLTFAFFTFSKDGTPQFTGTLGGVPFAGRYGLTVVYGVWILVILILYPLCKKYNAYKSTHNNWWLSYI